MNEIIYLEPSEEITSVIDKIRTLPGDSASFVIPRGATIAQSIVNLKLLKKSAEGMKKEISLVAIDRISRNLASQIGLTVYSKVSEAQKARPKTPAATPDENSEAEDNSQFRVNNYYRNKDIEEDEEEAEDLEQMAEEEANEPAEEHMQEDVDDFEDEEREKPEQDGSIDEEGVEIKKRPIENIESEPPKNGGGIYSVKPEGNHSTNIRGSKKPLIAFIAIFFILLLASAYLLVPRATIKIQLKTDDFSAEKEIVVDRNATASDVDNLTIPGKLISVEKEVSKQFDATGKKDIGTNASGILTFNNNAGIDDQIAAGATVKSSGGVEFTVDQAVTVPKATAAVSAGGQLQLNAGKATGKVTAKNPGEKSNLPSTTVYSVTGKPLITALGETTGGVSREVKLVTEEDLAKAELSIKEETSKLANIDLIESAKKEKLNIFEDSTKSEIISSSSSKNANDEADKFDYNIKLKFYVIGYAKSDLDNMLILSSEKSLKADRMLVSPDKAEISYKLTDNDIDNGVLKIESKFAGKTGPEIKEDVIKKQVKGKGIAKAESLILDNKDIEKVEVSIWPNLLKQVPFLTSCIKVEFGFAE